jgi:hypothetical protein
VYGGFVVVVVGGTVDDVVVVGAARFVVSSLRVSAKAPTPSAPATTRLTALSPISRRRRWRCSARRPARPFNPAPPCDTA